MARSSIGVDIGTRAVGIAEVSGTNSHRTVTRFGRALLPEGSVDHGEIRDPQAVGKAVAGLYKKLGLSGRSVHVGVSNRHVVVRVIELPAMSREDLGSAIRFQAQEHIPIPLDEAVVDYQVLEELTRDGVALQRVLVVAAERTTIDPLLAALQAAKLEPSTLELNVYPLVRCFGEFGDEGTEAIIDIGAGVTNIVVHQGGTIRFTRILPTFGGDDFTKAIADGFGVSHDDAEALKRRAATALASRVGQSAVEADAIADAAADAEATSDENEADMSSMTSDGTSVAPTTPSLIPRRAAVATSTGSDVDRAADLIDPVVRRFVNEIRGSIEFYTGQADSPSLDRVVLTGGGALLGGLPERLEEALGVSTQLGRPLSRVPVGKMKVSPDQVLVAEPFLGVAVGLAMAGGQS